MVGPGKKKLPIEEKIFHKKKFIEKLFDKKQCIFSSNIKFAKKNLNVF